MLEFCIRFDLLFVLRMYTVDSDDHVEIPLGVIVQGDVRIVVAHAQTLLGLLAVVETMDHNDILSGTATSTFMFSIAFHTGFVKDGAWTLERLDRGV